MAGTAVDGVSVFPGRLLGMWTDDSTWWRGGRMVMADSRSRHVRGDKLVRPGSFLAPEGC